MIEARTWNFLKKSLIPMTSNNFESDIIFFKETFRLLNVNLRKFEYRLKTHHFTHDQKKLLQAFYLFKKNSDKEHIFALLKGHKLTNPFYEGVRLYLLGMVCNHFGEFAFAVEHLTKAVKNFQHLDEDGLCICALSSLILAYGNQKNLKLMASHVDLMKEYTPSTDRDRLLMVQSEVLYLILSGNLPKAQSLLNKTLARPLEAVEDFKPSFLLLSFDISFKKKQYSQCSQFLEDYKKMTGFIVKANYLYMRTLLDHITNRKPLYIYARNFKLFPELHHQLEVIRNLALGEKKAAASYWSLLSKHNSLLYGPDFKYQGDYSLFSCALEMHSSSARSPTIDLKKIKSLKGPLQKLDYILSSSHAPLSKAELIRLIWNEEDTEICRIRLRKLVSNYNKNFHKNVFSYQDTYQLEKIA